jgi:hypothetical protein
MSHNIAGLGNLAIVVALWGLLVTIFWMVVGWRAMRAHEKIADRVDEIARKP